MLAVRLSMGLDELATYLFVVLAVGVLLGVAGAWVLARGIVWVTGNDRRRAK